MTPNLGCVLREVRATTLMARVNWEPIIRRAAEVVSEYETPPTLRALFYRLFQVEQLIPNTEYAYSRLSRLSAQGRREGWFPPLADMGAGVSRPQSFASPVDSFKWLIKTYRRDRAEGQPYTIYAAIEKESHLDALTTWFWEYGVPCIALGGYGSQTLMGEVQQDVKRTRSTAPSVLLYAGDFDPSGEDILRDLRKRTDCWDVVRQVALRVDQVLDWNLPQNPGKTTDARAKAFAEKYGAVVQVELDALLGIEENRLRDLYLAELGQWWDEDVYQKALEAEDADVDALVTRWNGNGGKTE